MGTKKNMAEFKRSRLERKQDELVSGKTIFLGLLTVCLFVLVVVFGLPFLVRFSVFLGDARNGNSQDVEDIVLPPLAPRLIVPYEATNSARIVIKGLAEPRVMVELLKNDVAVDTVKVSDEGDFSFDFVDLSDGENEFSAVAMTEEGGSSVLSEVLLVLFDNVPPVLEMQNPVEDKLTVDYDDFDVLGKSELGVSVLVNGRVAMVDDEGGFKIKMQLQMGKNEFEIVVRDLAGNETRRKIEIIYDI